MMKKLMLLAVLVVGFVALCPAVVMAWEDPICRSGSATPEQRELAGCNETRTVFEKIPGAVTAAFSVAGVIAAAVILFAGVRYAMSQGDPSKVKQAKDMIMYAIIGLIVTLSAFAITAFVLGAL